MRMLKDLFWRFGGSFKQFELHLVLFCFIVLLLGGCFWLLPFSFLALHLVSH